jgi:hypothetical protein
LPIQWWLFADNLVEARPVRRDCVNKVAKRKV